ncbi:MAG: TIGR04282 family arsenosugar biosynthesis glycosyltransferase [Deltaproteobacteria bacterium]|nr:TIGR04282 family arsenosugar biosynthesis glycosyltransferase [Deltaproteobacteria bacterium]
MTTHANALVIMAKAPVPRQVKTRLIPFLSAEDAAELSRCLFLDLLATLERFSGGEFFLAFSPPESFALFHELVPSRCSLFPQRGNNLGERMGNIFEDLLGQGYKNIVIIGSDLPVFPLHFLEEAFAALEPPGHEVVLGPTRDGGYYLIGMRRPIPEIFERIPWGSETVFSTTIHKLDSLGVPTYRVPVWFDIDAPEDLLCFEAIMDSSEDGPQRNTLRFLKNLAR